MTTGRRHTGLIPFVVFAAILLLTTGCASVDKFIQPDELVLNRNKFEVVNPDGSKPSKEIYEALDDMKKFVKQKPNTHVLGFGPRLSMRIYCLSNPNKSNFLHNYLRRKGKAPVVFDDYAASQTCNQIESLLQSKGCFYSTVTYDTVRKGRHNIDVVYNITPSERYQIDDVSFHAYTPEVDKLLKQWKNESLIVPGDYYDQEKLTAERTRISERLRNEGYYYASPYLILFFIDTAFDDHKMSIKLDLHDPLVSDTSRRTMPLQKYRIDEIFIYPNTSNSNNDADPAFDTAVTTMSFRNNTTEYKYLFNQPMTISPKVINRALFLFHRQTFRPQNISRTYNSLMGLRNFKYINIDFVESPNSCDTNRLLNAKVRLLNAKRQRLSASIEVNNSSPFGEQGQGFMNGNFGLETKLAYNNKNLFGGAEQFKAEWSLLVELPKLIFNSDNSELGNNVSSFEHSLNLSLDLPTFLFPFTRDILWQRMRPHTLITLGSDYQLHSYFERLLFNTGFGYTWHRNLHTHQMLPLELTFVRFFNIDSSFRSTLSSINDARIKYQYSDHFIMDARYDYVYNSQQYGTRNNFNFFHLSVESAGNLLGAIFSIAGTKTDENGIHTIFGVPFSQYLRVNSEFKHYFYIGSRSTIITRIIAGIGLPYGNSRAMPYEKSFFGGGPTTIRAWHLRRLGPGSFLSDSDNMLDRIGDIQLVANLEYRFPVVSIFEGALFADMGNVWLTNESQEFPDGQFRFDKFYKDIAVGIGVGIRANISIVTLRCDLAIPLYDPGQVSSHRWRPPYWKLSQTTVNFGIDYPF